jgi:hypothetical protein
VSYVDPPAIRWIPEGEHVGFYVYVPCWGKWRRFGLNGAGEPLGLKPVDALPEGSEALYCFTDVGHVLDAYRETIVEDDEAITESGGITDEGHERAKTSVLAELIGSEEYAVICADERYAQKRRQHHD